MNYYISIDIGGSSIKAACLSSENLRHIPRIGILYDKVDSNYSYAKLTAIIRFLIDKMIKENNDREPSGIGFSIAGLIDNRDFTIIQSPNLPSLDNKNLIRDISDDHICPISIVNDALGFTLGEYSRYEKWMHPFIGITLGTGIGGGIIIDQKPFIGYGGYGFEVGHMSILKEGPVCSCGRKGCLESFCGGFALKRKYISNCIDQGRDIPDNIEVHNIAQMAMQGDDTAKALFSEMGQYLGRAMGSILNLFNPRIIVFGGKISRSFHLFKKEFFEELEMNSYSAIFNDVSIEYSEDSDMSHFIGSCLVFNRKELENFILF